MNYYHHIFHIILTAHPPFQQLCCFSHSSRIALYTQTHPSIRHRLLLSLSCRSVGIWEYKDLNSLMIIGNVYLGCNYEPTKEEWTPLGGNSLRGLLHAWEEGPAWSATNMSSWITVDAFPVTCQTQNGNLSKVSLCSSMRERERRRDVNQSTGLSWSSNCELRNGTSKRWFLRFLIIQEYIFASISVFLLQYKALNMLTQYRPKLVQHTDNHAQLPEHALNILTHI